MRLENFERKKSRKHKYRGDLPANLAESIPRVAACGGGDARATCACRPGIAAAPCSALVAPFWRAPGERHGAPLRYPTIRGTTLGIADDTRIPPAAASDRPDTMGGSCLVPVMHWTSARRACGGVCAPLRHSRSHGFCARCEQRRALDAQVCCEAPFLAQPALCMHTPRAHYPAVRLERTDHGRLPFLACTRCPLFRSPPVVFGKVDTGVLCPSYFRTHHTVCLSQHPVNDTWVLRIAVAWSLCALTMFHQDLFLCVLRTVMSFAPGHIERTPLPVCVAPSYGLCAHSFHGFVSRPSASCALLLPSSFEAAHTDA